MFISQRPKGDNKVADAYVDIVEVATIGLCAQHAIILNIFRLRQLMQVKRLGRKPARFEETPWNIQFISGLFCPIIVPSSLFGK